jgi:hypothetical protein
VLDHFHEFLKADLAVAILVSLHDGFVDNLLMSVTSLSMYHVCTHLLQLLVFEVASNHHLQYYEELAVADIAVAIDVVHAEGKPQLLLLVAFATERREARHELLEVDVAATVFVEDRNHAGRKRVRGDLGEG